MNELNLNLTDPSVIEKLKETDVLRQTPTTSDKESLESKIKSLQQGATFTLKLTGEQLTRVKRDAESASVDWKTFLQTKIEQEIFSAQIGTATISAPSWATGKKISGPTNGLFR